MSYLVTGALAGQFHLNYHLYVNFIVIFFLVKNTGSPLVGIHISKFAILLLNFRGQTKR